MDFKLTTSSMFYNDADKLVLEKLGFRFNRTNNFANCPWIRLSGSCIEINTLDELLAFIDRHGQVILDKDLDGGWRIEIYDDCRE